jgi:translation elongation factor EF-4
MLHLDVVRERLIDEHDITPIITQPSITYLAMNINGKE